MTKRTHVQGGMLSSVVGFMLLRYYGLLYSDMNLFTQWLIMYPFCLWGSTWLDLDHHIGSIPSKDYASKIIHKLLHLGSPLIKQLDKSLTEKQKKESTQYKVLSIFNAKHRSWQTHSTWTIEILLFILYCLVNGKFVSLSAVEITCLSLILTGVIIGSIEHLLLDILTPEGIWIMEFIVINKVLKKKVFPEKLVLVPKFKSRKLRKRFNFSTGSEWEFWVQRMLKLLTRLAIVVSLFVLVYPYIKSYIPFEFRRYL